MSKAIFAAILPAILLATAAIAQSAAGAYLGAEMAPLTPEVQRDLQISRSQGAAVGDILPGSPAAAAGLKPDDVITGIDGRAVEGPEDVIAAVGRHKAGDRVTLQTLDGANNHRPRTITVTLSARPNGFRPGPQGPAQTQTPPAAATANVPPRANNAAAGTALVATQPLRNQFCRALAPQGWGVIDQDDRGATYTVASPDRRLIAAYGIVAINSGQVAGYYGPQFTSPAAFAQFLAATLAGQAVQPAGTQPFNGMQVMNFRGAGREGFVIYRTYPLPADPGGFIISARIAIGGGPADVPVAGAVAAGIECNTTFKAPPGGYAQVHAKAADTGTSKRCKAGDCNDSDLAGTYNAQLGTGYVHSSSGTNYLVDTAKDYRATGPDGPGYYRQNGNFLEKLEPGRAD